jgi:glycerate kinase
MGGDRAAPPYVLLAPDSFKGTFSAASVASALARGVESAGGEAVRCPLGDGGEGTMDALLSAAGGEVRRALVTDPLGRPTEARFALLNQGRVGLVETAEASGLALLAEDERDPVAASSRGTGELIVAAVRAGAESILLGVGGSASTDGGQGALEALDEARVSPRILVLCDVVTCWEDAPITFGPQKGADARAVARLERRLEAIAARAPKQLRGVPRTGCAGGLSGGLWAFRDAELLPGARYVLDRLGFDELARGASAVVTGEGCLDAQSFSGKVVGEVASRCARLGVSCHAVVGRAKLSIERAAGLGLAEVTVARTPSELAAAGRSIAERCAALASR